MKFLHAADIHLDSAVHGLPAPAGMSGSWPADPTRAAFVNLVDLALEEGVDLVVVAGDLYDGDWKDFGTGLFLAREMGRLDAAGIAVFIAHGNHDAQSVLTRRLTLPANVTVFPAARAGTVVLERPGVAVHGRSYAARDVREDLSATYPAPLPGVFNIGVLHTAADGRDGHEPYAPCDPAALAAKGYDYWALGHVHRRRVLSETPPILFPGNLQGRHVRETAADGKGATVVTVDGGGRIALCHRALDVVRWAVVEVDAGGLAGWDDLVTRTRAALEDAAAAADGRALAVRVRIAGATPLHGRLAGDGETLLNEVRAQANALGGATVRIEKVVTATRPAVDVAALRQRPDALGDLVRSVDVLAADAEARAALSEDLATLARVLPAVVRDDGGRLAAPDDEAAFAALIDEARDLLLARLADEETVP